MEPSNSSCPSSPSSLFNQPSMSLAEAALNEHVDKTVASAIMLSTKKALATFSNGVAVPPKELKDEKRLTQAEQNAERQRLWREKKKAKDLAEQKAAREAALEAARSAEDRIAAAEARALEAEKKLMAFEESLKEPLKEQLDTPGGPGYAGDEAEDMSVDG